MNQAWGFQHVIRFMAVDPPGPAVFAFAGPDPAKFSSDGGWSLQPRPRRSGFTEYDGVAPYTLTVPVLFDKLDTGDSVEAEIETLRRLMRDRVGPRAEPAVVQVAGASVPLTHLVWVIQDLEFGDEIKRNDGARSRAFVTVTLYQYLAADILVSVKASPAQAAQERMGVASVGGTASVTTSRTYTVRQGDTLSSIAASQLGSAGRYTEIASLNGIRDPNAITAGQVLRLP